MWPQPGVGTLGEWPLFWEGMCKLKSRGLITPGKDACWGLQQSPLFTVLLSHTSVILSQHFSLGEVCF